ncbi:flavin monoamine oxidase family protein [Streptomyces sp. NPDC059989]|uniref:flavin monoamine oxidase family protein n=1 Tax=Streptomyces sp. NPDC059989 TaxID=3347026 RepID=UPI0036B71150
MSSRPTTERRQPARQYGRRSILKATGATALAGMAGATVLGAGEAAATDEILTDVIVVGAGYAGGTAARELTAKGLDVVVLEARDRIGGRIWTDTFAGERIELGGGWLSPDHHLVAKEFQRYGLTNVADVMPTKSVMPGVNGLDALSPADANARLAKLFEQFFAGSEQYFERPNEPLFRKDLLAKVDPLSFADRIAQLPGLSDVDRKWLEGYFVAYTGGDNTSRSMTSMAQWWALGGWTMEGWEKQTAYKPADGMTALLQKMLTESRARVMLKSPVASVTSTATGVQVRLTSGRLFKASAVVMAIPVNMWKTIQFNPGLPAVHAAATAEGVGVGLATKMWIHLSGNVEAVYGMGTQTSALPLVIPQKALPGGGRLMVGFAGSSLDVKNQAAVQDAIRAYVPGATVVSYKVQEWGRDPYARGGWGLRRPGQLLKQLPAIQQPHGRIVFAGGDIASGWNGAFIEGAVETGFRAAEQAAAIAW